VFVGETFNLYALAHTNWPTTIAAVLRGRVAWWGPWDLTVIYGGTIFQSAHFEPFRPDYPKDMLLLHRIIVLSVAMLTVFP